MRQRFPRLVALYGLAFDPEFEENQTIYLCFVLKNGENGTRVSRFRVRRASPLRCDPGSEEVLITWRGGGHNGGCLQFGPDRHLYISTGDGTGPFPPDGLKTGQDNRDLLSAILRIDPHPSRDGMPYTVPADNPFVGVKDVRPEIWAYGFRNPWKMSFDPIKGDLWVGDVGWELWEMVYRVERAGNYGWSVTEGRQPVHPEGAKGITPILPPVVQHSHAEARSVTGGRVYRGERQPELTGAYIYADYETGKVWGLRHDGKKVSWHEELAEARLKIVAFGESHTRELYMLDHIGGTIHRLVENPEGDRHLGFPRKLSDTGLFASTPSEEPAPGVLPYFVNAEPWADHATTRRFIGLPGASQIERPHASSNSERSDLARWTFPNDTVLVKTFELEMERGNPARRQKIETQILHFANQVWRGYTYEWNEEQTDATLVEAAGRNRELTVVDSEAPGGERRQSWRFFSRSECIICHNFFNGYELGFNLRQLNRSWPDESGRSTPETDSTEARHQLRVQVAHGLYTRRFRAVETLPRFASPYRVDTPARKTTTESAAQLTARARSYLHANCSHCHQRHGGGTSWMELPYEIPLEKTNTVGRPPSQGNFGIEAAKILWPGRPLRSLLYYRMATLGPARMPHMGSDIVDERGLRLIHDWVEGLPADSSVDAGADPTGTARAAQSAALQELRSTAGSPGRTGELVERLLSSTHGAFLLMHSIDAQALPEAVSKEVVEHAAGHSNLNVRGLFTRFLPASQRAEELRSTIDPGRIMALQGDLRRGRALVLQSETLQCKNCHTFDGTLESVGPDLSLVGMRLERGELLQSIIEPSRTVDPRYATYLLVTKHGEAFTGVVTKKTAKEVTLRDAQNRVIHIPAGEVESLSLQPLSLMPERLLRGLTSQEAADLLDFLSSLR